MGAILNRNDSCYGNVVAFNTVSYENAQFPLVP